MSKEFMLTTIDNPFNPFTQFDDWFAFDLQKNYCTCALLDKFSYTSNDLEDEDNEIELNRAMDEIVSLFNGKIFKKVSIDDYKE